MFGEQYFRDRLIDIYDFSPVRYTHGTGELFYSNSSMSVQWELVVSITGEQLLVLHTNGGITHVHPGDHGLSLTGSLKCETWDISIPSMIVLGVSVGIGNEAFSSMTCCARDIFLKKKGISKNQIDQLEGLISNFDFLGSEVTQEITQKGLKESLDQITVTIRDQEVCFRTIHEAKLIKEQITSRRIDRAILSSVKMKPSTSNSLEELSCFLESICLFLSLISINSCMCPIIKHWTGTELQKIHIRDSISSPYHRNVFIDNSHVRHGIRDILSNCYEEFVRIDSSINMRLLVHNLLGMYEGKFIENKLVGLVITYEFLLTRYLVILGYKLEDVKDLSVQDKLCRLNNHMRFIPSKLLGDGLREKVRNPMFHTGEIVILSGDQKYKIYTEYLDLLIQIILRILGYDGRYISPIDFEVRSIHRQAKNALFKN